MRKIADALGVTVLYLMGNPDFDSLNEAQNEYSRYLDDSRWEKITEDILLSVYGKKREDVYKRQAIPWVFFPISGIIHFIS